MHPFMTQTLADQHQADLRSRAKQRRIRRGLPGIVAGRRSRWTPR